VLALYPYSIAVDDIGLKMMRKEKTKGISRKKSDKRRDGELPHGRKRHPPEEPWHKSKRLAIPPPQPFPSFTLPYRVCTVPRPYPGK